MQGTFTVAARGFGFVNTIDENGEEKSYFVHATNAAMFLPGDVLSFQPTPGKKPDQFNAENLKLVSRASKLMLGTVEHEFGQAVLVPDENCFCKIQLEGTHHVAADTIVAVRIQAISEQDARRHVPAKFVNARLERVLGPRAQGNFETEYALARQDFPVHFPTEVFREMIKMENTVNVDNSAINMTQIPFVTVDGTYTKDFDDAVYVVKLEKGWKAYVAIADVSYYVRPGSAIDREAHRRATSVYLGSRVVPMLPENLSNGLCSLMPNVVRRAVVAEITVDDKGNVISEKSKVHRAFIKSAARITYDEMTRFLETEGKGISWTEEVNNSLIQQHQLYKVLEEHQVHQVMSFEDPEPQLITNDDGLADIAWHHRTLAHLVVEQMMLLANRYVASFKKITVQRYQPAPSNTDWATLKQWLAKKGVDADLPEEASLEAIKKLLVHVDSRPDKETLLPKVVYRIRRTLQRAEYVVDNKGHFSLGYEAYTHFTSPIRRYADLLVHRQLLDNTQKEAIKDLKSLKGDVVVNAQVLQCSERSSASRIVERDVWDRIKKRIMYRKHHDETLKTQVVSANLRGILVAVDVWQTPIGISAEYLEALGYQFDAESALWAEPSQQLPDLELGAVVYVKPTALTETRQRVEITGELIL